VNPQSFPDLGVHATVVMDRETHSPTTMYNTGEGLRELEEALDYGENIPAVFIEEIDIVAARTLHIALYGLQQGIPDAIARALKLIGISGDCEEHIDSETFLPLPVPEPYGWAA